MGRYGMSTFSNLSKSAPSNWYTDFMKQGHYLGKIHKEQSPLHAQIRKMLINIFEDERIEQRIIEEHPGMAGYIRACKRYTFARKMFEPIEENDKNDALLNFINGLITAVRYPPMASDITLEKYAKEYTAIAKILAPELTTFEDVIRRAEEVHKIINHMMPEPPPPQENDQQGEEGDESGREG